MHYISIIGIVAMCSFAGVYAGGFGKKRILFFLEFAKTVNFPRLGFAEQMKCIEVQCSMGAPLQMLAQDMLARC